MPDHKHIRLLGGEEFQVITIALYRFAAGSSKVVAFCASGIVSQYYILYGTWQEADPACFLAYKPSTTLSRVSIVEPRESSHESLIYLSRQTLGSMLSSLADRSTPTVCFHQISLILYRASLCHGGILLLESLLEASGALQILINAAHDAGLFTVDERLGGEVIDTVVEAALDHLGVHLERDKMLDLEAGGWKGEPIWILLQEGKDIRS